MLGFGMIWGNSRPSGRPIFDPYRTFIATKSLVGWIMLPLERNMRCGVALCGHCQLGPMLVCRDGPVVGYDLAAPLLAVKEL